MVHNRKFAPLNVLSIVFWRLPDSASNTGCDKIILLQNNKPAGPSFRHCTNAPCTYTLYVMSNTQLWQNDSFRHILGVITQTKGMNSYCTTSGRGDHFLLSAIIIAVTAI